MSRGRLPRREHLLETERLLREAGYEFEEVVGGKHGKLVVQVNGREETVVVSSSPSDRRAVKNAVGFIKRKIREWKAEAGIGALTASAANRTLEIDEVQSINIRPQVSSDSMTMSSREMADLVEKRHDNVKRTIETLAHRGVIVRPQIEDEQFTDAKGRLRFEQVYRIGKRDSYVIVAQLSPEFTARLVDRWQELEEGNAPEVRIDALLHDPAKLRELLLDNVEKVLVLEAEIEEAKPLVAAYEHLSRTDGTFCITDTAKALDMRPKDLFSLLQSKKWIYRRAGSGHWVGYQDKVQQGLIDHRVHEITKGDGSSKITEQVRITSKGLTSLGKLVTSPALT